MVIDARKQLPAASYQLSVEQIKGLCSRSNSATKGCDQLLILKESEKADLFMQIYNADSSEVDACGNATRCIADMLYKETGRLPVTIETNAAILQGVEYKDGYILVDMGRPRFAWGDIPLSMEIIEAAPKIKELFGLDNPYFVSMGNPHVVFFMDELPSDEDVARIGAQIENCVEIFPKRVNVSFAVPKPPYMQVKVWERGAGLTKACGTGACAILAAANKQADFFTDITVVFENSGESVSVQITKENHILLGGKIEKEFEGVAEI